MNNDYLRVNSKERDDGITESSFTSSKSETRSAKNEEQKITLFSLFRHSSANALGWSGPKTRNILTMLLVSILFSVVLYLVAIVSYSIAALIAAVCVNVIALPLCLIVLFYELNVMKNVGIFEICIGTLIGALYYLIVMLIESSIKERITFGYATANIYAGVVTVLEDVLLFAIAHLCARLFKKDCVFGTILIVACVFGGYIVADTLTEMTNGLFVNETAGGLKIYVGSDSAEFNEMIKNFMPTLIKESVVMSALMCTWTVISGALISILLSPVRKKYLSNATVYALFCIVVAMHVAVTLEYSYGPLTVLIYCLTIAVSVLLAIKLLNYSVEITNFSVSDEEKHE